MNTGLDINHLQDYWARRRSGRSGEGDAWVRDTTLLAGLRLNVREVLAYLHSERPSFAEFEAWIVDRNAGTLDAVRLDRLRRALAGERVEPEVSLEGVAGLSADDLAHWDEHGYVVLRKAVSEERAAAAESAIYRHLQMNPDDPESWYSLEQGHTIWVPLLRDPAIEANRRSARIAKAFSQLWGREDLWVTFDQAGFNPPERPGWMFPGPHLHWDTTLAKPHALTIGGILYLNDVAEDQGAFCCVPGFHRELNGWRQSVPAGADARAYALETLTPRLKPIAAERGDMVLWHQLLPHASSANRAAKPRVVQYCTMHPTAWEHNPVWE